MLDILRFAMGKREHPQRIHCTGGLHDQGAPTDQETPNVQSATFEYADGATMRCDVQGWFCGNEGAGSFVYGTEGWMSLDGREGPKIYLGRKNEPGPDLRKQVPERGESDLVKAHFQNFIDCVHSRKWQDLNADVEEGYMSTALCHLGNISYRLKRPLVFDGRTERFKDEDANKYLKREYRAPFVVPEKV